MLQIWNIDILKTIYIYTSLLVVFCNILGLSHSYLSYFDPSFQANALYFKVDFEDVLGEPDGAHSFDKVWIFSYKCYRCGLGCCYKLLTLLCGLCIALYWGCTFACLTFEHVWCWTPYMRCFSIFAGACQKFLGIIMNCCCAPFCETCGLFFSKITVHNK